MNFGSMSASQLSQEETLSPKERVDIREPASVNLRLSSPSSVERCKVTFHHGDLSTAGPKSDHTSTFGARAATEA